jgi:hypothetical protein
MVDTREKPKFGFVFMKKKSPRWEKALPKTPSRRLSHEIDCDSSRELRLCSELISLSEFFELMEGLFFKCFCCPV